MIPSTKKLFRYSFYSPVSSKRVLLRDPARPNMASVADFRWYAKATQRLKTFFHKFISVSLYIY